jgi:hypothetical protein
MKAQTVSYVVPYVCQYASPHLVRALITGDYKLELDPEWHTFGAASPEDYAYWAPRACGIACVKMAIEALTHDLSQPMRAWVQAGLDIDGYLIRESVEIGWKHAALAQLISDCGFYTELSQNLTAAQISDQIRADRIVIASVSPELGREGLITRTSGHLVVVFGIRLTKEGEVSGVFIHNPSGHSPALQKNACIPVDRFTTAFSGRGITVGRFGNGNDQAHSD